MRYDFIWFKNYLGIPYNWAGAFNVPKLQHENLAVKRFHRFFDIFDKTFLKTDRPPRPGVRQTHCF